MRAENVTRKHYYALERLCRANGYFIGYPPGWTMPLGLASRKQRLTELLGLFKQ